MSKKNPSLVSGLIDKQEEQQAIIERLDKVEKYLNEEVEVEDEKV